jgi:hypothetical protein
LRIDEGRVLGGAADSAFLDIGHKGDADGVTLVWQAV